MTHVLDSFAAHAVILEVAFALLLFLVGMLSPVVRLNEWHHGYLGIALFSIGTVLVHDVNWYAGVFFIVAGLVLTLDDAWQHLLQAVCRPDYRSPLHKLYIQAARRWPWLMQVAAWLDARLS